MTIFKELLLLDPVNIDCSAAWILWPEEPAQQLLDSLRDLSQVTPVLVEPDAGQYRLIAGYKRVSGLAQLGRKVAALLVPPQDAENDNAARVRKGLLYLASNSTAASPPTVLRTLAALRYFQPLLDAPAMAEILAQQLELRPKSRVWQRFMAWIELFEPGAAFDRHLAADRIPLDAIDTLAKLDATEHAAVEPFFREAHWSVGATRQFLQALFEAARMQGCRVDEALEATGAVQCLQARETGLSPKDMIEAVLERVRAFRWPRATALRDRFARLATELSAGTRWRLAPGVNFEKDGLALSTHVADRAALRTALTALAAMTESCLWDRLAGLANEAPTAEDA